MFQCKLLLYYINIVTHQLFFVISAADRNDQGIYLIC